MHWMLRTLLTICLVALPLFLYIGFRLASSVEVLMPGTWARARLAMLLIIGWLYLFPVGTLILYALRISGNAFLSPTTMTAGDFLFHFPLWTLLITVLELTVPFLLADLAALVIRFIPSVQEQGRTILAWGRVGGFALAMLYVTGRVYADTDTVRDHEERIGISGLPQELDGLRISLLGDIQVDQYTGDRKVAWMRDIVQQHQPDILLSSGDLVTSGTAFLSDAERAISGLHGTIATIAVLGDHDVWSSPEAIRKLHERSGWTFLDNEHRVITARGRTILVTGLTHVYADRLGASVLSRFLDEAPKADVKILLVHQPARGVVQEAMRHGYNVVLAGHTHGGQIVLHPLGIPVTPSMRETPYYSGIYKEGSTTIAVTRGIGVTLAPVRYHAQAEVLNLVMDRARE